MDDDLERRLRADAARQSEIVSPSLDRALAAATSRRRSSMISSLAVAASVVLIGGAGVVLARAGTEGTNSSGGGGGGSRAADSGSGAYRLRGLLQEDAKQNPRQVTVLFDIGSCTQPRLFSVRLAGENAGAVHIKIDAVSAEASSGKVSAVNDLQPSETGGLSGTADTVPTGTADTVPTGGSSGSPGVPTEHPDPGGSGRCTWTQTDGGKVTLAAPPGKRVFYVESTRLIVMSAQFPGPLQYLPSGYHVVSMDQPQNDRLSAFVQATNRKGDVLGVDYAPTQSIPAGDVVVGHADVNGYRATETESPGSRRITWTLDGGAVVQVYSQAKTPLSTAELLKIARKLR